MSSQDDNQDQRVAAIVVIAAVLLSVGLALGFGISKARTGAVQPSTGVLSATVASAAPLEAGSSAALAPAAGELSAAAASPSGAVILEDQAQVVVSNGVVTFYFASGKTELASGALEALNDAIAAAKTGKTLVISGFHDTTGDAAANAELAKNRAINVRDALVNAGVALGSIDLKKPEQSADAGNNAQARRVEVVIAG